MTDDQGRARRRPKPPRWMEEVADPDEALAEGEPQPPKYVFKLLHKSDITHRTFIGRDVFVLWPDNGLWYRAVIQKCNPARMTGTIYYDDTEEQEDDADLDELIREKSLAYRVKRPGDYACGPDEMEGEVYVDKKKRGRQPASTQRHGWRRDVSEDEDEEEEQEDQEEELQGRQKRRPENVLPKRESPLSKRPSPAVDDAIVRSKVRAAFEQTLEQALQEIGDDESGKDRPPKDLAVEIEHALLNLYGGTTKDYKNKMRTLHFNLKDPQNVELRLHVIRGDISPESFVRMSANELASKELAEYRRKKEEEALKMSVLDAEAAAKFSTAAALDARDRLAIPSAYVADKLLAVRDKSPERGEGLSHHEGQQQPQQQPQQQSATKTAAEGDLNPVTSLSEEGKSVLSAQPLDWASIKAQAVQRASTEPMSTKMDAQQHKFQPLPEFESLQTHTAFKEQQDKHETKSSSGSELQHIFLPNEMGPADSVWRSVLVVPGSATVAVTVDAKAGGGDLSVLLGTKDLVVRGRLSLPKLEGFLSELHLSKHRTATLGVMRAAATAALKEKNDFATAIVAGYRDQDRAGVAEGHPGSETYLIPPSELASSLCQVTGNPPLDNDQLLTLVVHRKELVQRQGPHSLPAALPSSEPKNEPPPPVPSALPPGLDLSAISALAQAFGVAPQPSSGSVPRPMVPPTLPPTSTTTMAFPPPGVPYHPPSAPRPMAPYKPPRSPQ